MMHCLRLALFSIAMTALTLAKPVSDGNGIFSLELSSNWVGGPAGAQMNLPKGAQYFTSTDHKSQLIFFGATDDMSKQKMPIDTLLNGFATGLAQQHAQKGDNLRIQAGAVGKSPARFIQIIDAQRVQTLGVITLQGNNMAEILLRSQDAGHYEQLCQSILAGFRWL